MKKYASRGWRALPYAIGLLTIIALPGTAQAGARDGLSPIAERHTNLLSAPAPSIRCKMTDEAASPRAASLVIEMAPLPGLTDWFANPTLYAPDSLSDYAIELVA